MIFQETIQEAIGRLVKAYNPLEIYLFGACAWGKLDKASKKLSDDDEIFDCLVFQLT